ncbi:MAG: hypothetical protein LQ349_005986 [Xanthoria aureola]|nr:MAG: hypothetical protein LQ349_008811 [Xanthoria aureola]KAI4230860.1 MAG: hypothetical protein LQ349_005986 [Xanthoria aureola]
MSDLRERLQKLLAPQFPHAELDEYERQLAKKYKSAYNAFYRDQKRTKCGTKLMDITAAVKKEANTKSVWQSYILCKAFLLGALFEARPKALDNLDRIRRYLATFKPNGKAGSSNFEKDRSEMTDLGNLLEKRLDRERNPEFIKETWFFHCTTSWPVRLTDEWLEQTTVTSE